MSDCLVDLPAEHESSRGGVRIGGKCVTQSAQSDISLSHWHRVYYSAPEYVFLVVSDLLLDYSCVDYFWEFSENVPTNHTVLLSDWFGVFFCGSLELRQLLVGVLFCSCVLVGRLTFRPVAK